MALILQDGFDFAFDPAVCEQCAGNCCIGTSGYIWVSRVEIKAISKFLGMQQEVFLQDYVRRAGRRFCLKELFVRGSYDCVFFDGHRRRCSIYPVRPAQCRTFPFWAHFKKNPEEAARECPGVVVLSEV